MINFKRHPQRRNFNKGKLTIGVFGLRFALAIVFLVSIVGSVLFAVQIALASSRMASLNLEEKKLVLEKKELEDKLVKGDSLLELAKKAEERGFYKLDNIVYLEGEKAVAKLP
ncbi:MAG: hypothetical protein CH104c_0252 [Candidatus Woesebacteria bacterium]|jgi:hypothetical protein|nr:MAG: hypothetical protein CH104c_0252 [Candidatus Woesebacteria bacterium]